MLYESIYMKFTEGDRDRKQVSMNTADACNIFLQVLKNTKMINEELKY